MSFHLNVLVIFGREVELDCPNSSRSLRGIENNQLCDR